MPGRAALYNQFSRATNNNWLQKCLISSHVARRRRGAEAEEELAVPLGEGLEVPRGTRSASLSGAALYPRHCRARRRLVRGGLGDGEGREVELSIALLPRWDLSHGKFAVVLTGGDEEVRLAEVVEMPPPLTKMAKSCSEVMV